MLQFLLGALPACALADFQFAFKGHIYEVITTGTTWSAASADAQSRMMEGQPGHLARIDSDEENEEVFRQLIENLEPVDYGRTLAPDGGMASYVWIGASDLQAEGVWTWSDSGDQFWQGALTGSPVGGLYNNWGDEPDNFRNQDAAGIALTDWILGFAGQWNDVDALNTLYYIIEYDTAMDEFSINPGISDAWFNPATNGQGFFITVFADLGQMFLAWFTYDVERPADGVTALLGDPGHRWVTAQGPYAGNTANLTIFVSEGGRFDASQPAVTTDPDGDGTLMLTFTNCAEGMVKYEITSLGLSGEIPIQRVVADNVPLCEALASP